MLLEREAYSSDFNWENIHTSQHTGDLMAPRLTELISSVVISTADKNQLLTLID